MKVREDLSNILKTIRRLNKFFVLLSVLSAFAVLFSNDNSNMIFKNKTQEKNKNNAHKKIRK